jgi:L-ascorbate metabolism protein UlaG (beta-lactamase superfamily)
MEIEFVCHASVVLRRDPVHMICDPWLTGNAFDDGWALLSEPVFKPEDFASITHLWFSHEHPDHFSPRSLAMIPEELRARITVLFHASLDRKVANHCEKLGFARVIELTPGEWRTLAPDFDVLCDTWEDSDDSWMLVRTPEGSILNVNDCQANTQAQVDALHASTGDVDVLLTQYSISAWDGNPEDVARRQAGAQAMLDRAVRQARTLKAKHVIPFASFIWFCHEENDYMNSGIRPVSDVAQILEEQTDAQPVVLYPGDRWTVGTRIDNSSAIAHYAADLATLPQRPRVAGKTIDLDELQRAAARFSERVKDGRSPMRLRLSAVKLNATHQRRLRPGSPFMARLAAVREILLLRIRPARIWLTDSETCVEYCLLRGLERSGMNRDDCDIELSSGALLYAFKFLWGGETLQINGRFREMYRDGRIPLFDYLGSACAMNTEAGAAAKPI